MAKSAATGTFVSAPKVSRPGVHSKTKTSKNKASKNYKKPYGGQGRWKKLQLSFTGLTTD